MCLPGEPSHQSPCGSWTATRTRAPREGQHTHTTATRPSPQESHPPSPQPGLGGAALTRAGHSARPRYGPLPRLHGGRHHRCSFFPIWRKKATSFRSPRKPHRPYVPIILLYTQLLTARVTTTVGLAASTTLPHSRANIGVDQQAPETLQNAGSRPRLKFPLTTPAFLPTQTHSRPRWGHCVPLASCHPPWEPGHRSESAARTAGQERDLRRRRRARRGTYRRLSP